MLIRASPAGTRGASPRAAVPLMRSALVRPRSREEHQPELADLHLVAAAEGRRLHPLPVDVGAVEAAHVPDGEEAALAVELGVAPRHGDVVEEDVTVGVPAA